MTICIVFAPKYWITTLLLQIYHAYVQQRWFLQLKKIADDVYHTRGYFSAVNKIFSAKWMAIEKYDVFSAYLNGRGRHLDAAPTAEDVD